MTRQHLHPPSDTSEGSRTPTPTIFTPSGETSPQGSQPSGPPSPFRSLRHKSTSPSPSLIHELNTRLSSPGERFLAEHELDTHFPPSWDENMSEGSPMHQPTDSRSQMPLLKDKRGGKPSESPNGIARPPFHARRSTFRSKSPEIETLLDTKKKYIYAAFFLILSLISFVVQTETAVYIQHDLGWDKAYCML